MAADHAGPASAYRIVIHRLFTTFRQEKTAATASTSFGAVLPCLYAARSGCKSIPAMQA